MKNLYITAMLTSALFLSGLALVGVKYETDAAAASSNFGDSQYSINVVDQRGFNGVPGSGNLTTGILAWVYDAGTKTNSTIYADRKRTAKTNPISRAQFATDGAILFYGPSTSYDIFVAHSDGSISSYLGVTPATRKVALDRATLKKTIIVPFTNASAATEVDSGIDLPKNSLLRDVAVEVTTAESSKTISAGLLSTGTGGDADGFIVTASTTTAGYVATTTVTTGSNENYLSAFLYGALMGSLKVGVDTAGRTGQTLVSGYKVASTNTTRISYTSSSGASTGAGNLYFFVDLLR